MEAEGVTAEMAEDAKRFEERMMLQDVVDEVVPDWGQAMHVACSKGYKSVAQALLRMKGADIESRDVYGWTPLHTAAFWDCHEVITLLVEMGADLNARTKDDESPYDLAVDRTTRALIRDLKKQNRRAGSRSISKGGKFGSTRYSAPHKQRGQIDMAKEDAAREAEKSRRASSKFLSAVDFTQEQLERLRMLPEHVWDEIEQLEAGVNGKSFKKYLWTILLTFVVIACLAAFLGLYFGLGQPCLPFQPCASVPYKPASGTKHGARRRLLRRRRTEGLTPPALRACAVGMGRPSLPSAHRLRAVHRAARLRVVLPDQYAVAACTAPAERASRPLVPLTGAGLHPVGCPTCTDLQNPPVPLCVPGNAAGYNSSSNGQACLVAPPDGGTAHRQRPRRNPPTRTRPLPSPTALRLVATDLNNPYLCVQCVDWMTSQCSIPTVTLNIILLVLVALGAVCLVIGIPIAIWRANANKSPIAGLLGTEELAEIRGSNANTGMASLKRKASTQQLLATNEEGAAMVRRLSMLKAHAGSETTLRKGERPNADRKMGDVADRKLRSASELKLPDPAAGTGSDTSSVRNAAAGPDDETPAETAAAATEPAPAPTAADVAEVVASVLAEAPPESNGDAPPAAAAPSPPPAEAAAEPTAADEPASAPAPAADASAADAPAEPAEDGDRVPLIQEPSNAGGGAPGESWAINEGDDGVPLAPSVAPTLPTQFEDVKEQPADATSVVSNTTDVMND